MPAQKYDAMNSRRNSGLGGLSCIGAPVLVSGLVSGAGNQASAGTISTHAIALKASHCSRQSRLWLISTTASAQPAIPRPRPEK